MTVTSEPFAAVNWYANKELILEYEPGSRVGVTVGEV